MNEFQTDFLQLLKQSFDIKYNTGSNLLAIPYGKTTSSQRLHLAHIEGYITAARTSAIFARIPIEIIDEQLPNLNY